MSGRLTSWWESATSTSRPAGATTSNALRTTAGTPVVSMSTATPSAPAQSRT